MFAGDSPAATAAKSIGLAVYKIVACELSATKINYQCGHYFVNSSQLLLQLKY